MKGTAAFGVSGGCAVATARTARGAAPAAEAPAPAEGSDYETFLAYYEGRLPGGEFNELLARMDAGLE